jgi:hypothetical protein
MNQQSVRTHAGLVRRSFRGFTLMAVFATGIGFGAVLVQAYDPRLDEALAALQKAAALVEASSAGDVSPSTQRTFDRNLAKALANIQDAMDYILAAGIAADSDSSLQSSGH